MACRIVNLHSQPLHIDLRGGEVLLLAPNERSRALYEEMLYDNQHIVDWERARWLQRIPARMQELRQEEAARSTPTGPDQPAARPGRKRATRAAAKAAPKPGAEPTRRQASATKPRAKPKPATPRKAAAGKAATRKTPARKSTRK